MIFFVVAAYVWLGIGVSKLAAPRILAHFPGDSEKDDRALYGGLVLLWLPFVFVMFIFWTMSKVLDLLGRIVKPRQ